MPAGTQRLQFEGSLGDVLAARLDLPEGKPRAYALYAHCFSCSKDILAAARLSSALRKHGMALLRFDFTGLGDSGGDFGETNFGSNLADLRCAAEFMRREYAAPQLLVGHSLGGAAVLAVAGDIPEVRAVATINAPSNATHVTHLFDTHLDTIRRHGEAKISLQGRDLSIQNHFIEDLGQHDILGKVAQLNRPLMIFHSPQDDVVSIDHAAMIYRAARHPKSFISLDNVDHMLTRPDDANYVAGILSAWAARFLDAADALE